MAQPDALEQYLLEIINKVRADAGVQPLASDSALNSAAESHSKWMIDSDSFSHAGAGGSDAGARMRAAGYSFDPSSWSYGENIGWLSTRGPDGYADEVEQLHANLLNSPTHRENLLNGDFKEVGLGLEVGEYAGWQGAFITENFARSGTASLLTGVAYADGNADGGYDPGEGLGGLTVDAENEAGAHFTATTMDAGGYDLPLAPGSYSVTFENASGATSPRDVNIGSSNVKLDAVNPAFTAATTGVPTPAQSPTNDSGSGSVPPTPTVAPGETQPTSTPQVSDPVASSPATDSAPIQTTAVVTTIDVASTPPTQIADPTPLDAPIYLTPTATTSLIMGPDSAATSTTQALEPALINVTSEITPVSTTTVDGVPAATTPAEPATVDAPSDPTTSGSGRGSSRHRRWERFDSSLLDGDGDAHRSRRYRGGDATALTDLDSRHGCGVRIDSFVPHGPQDERSHHWSWSSDWGH